MRHATMDTTPYVRPQSKPVNRTLLRAAAQRVLDCCKELGFRTGSTRIHHYQRELSRPDAVALPRELATCALEVPQLDVIFSVLGRDAQFHADLRKLLGGRVSSVLAPPEDPARDFQWQLYLAARMRAAGAVLRSAEPDIVAATTAGDFAIAAKRPHGDKKVATRISEGAEQIEREGLTGVVAIDMTLFPIEAGNMLAALVDDVGHVQTVADRFLTDTWARNERGIDSAMRAVSKKGYCQGVLFHLAVAVNVARAAQTVAVGESWAFRAVGEAPPTVLAEALPFLRLRQFAGADIPRPHVSVIRVVPGWRRNS